MKEEKEKKPSSDSYDPDLYHRALTGRGEPIRGEEVIALLETIEEQIDDYNELRKKYNELEEAQDWVVPKEEPYRRCSQCTKIHDRGDGRCERHGRFVTGPVDDIEPGSRHWNAERELEEARAKIAELSAALLKATSPRRRRSTGGSRPVD